MPQIDMLEFIEPFAFSYTDYYEKIREQNIDLQSKIGTHLTEQIKQLELSKENPFVIATTGSDGRFEKGPHSKVEIVVVKTLDRPVKGLINLLKNVKNGNNHVFYKLRPTDTDEENGIEEKSLESKTLSYYHGEQRREKLWPNRIFDATTLYSPDRTEQIENRITGKARMKVIEELRQNPGVFVEVYRKRKRDHRAISETGNQKFKGTEFKHFDLDEGISNYDGDRTAFKQAQIRYVQIGLTYDFFRYIIRKKPEDYALQTLMKTPFPKNTVHRFEYLHQNGHLSLSDKEVLDVCDSYQFFIWLTHQGEYLCTHKNQTTYDISKYTQEISERTRSLKNIFGKESQNGIMKA